MLLKQTPQILPLYQVPATHRGRNLVGPVVARKESEGGSSLQAGRGGLFAVTGVYDVEDAPDAATLIGQEGADGR